MARKKLSRYVYVKFRVKNAETLQLLYRHFKICSQDKL